MASVRYADSPWGRLSFHQDGDVVWVYTKTSRLGGWRLERFGGALNAKGIRQWLEVVSPPTPGHPVHVNRAG